MQNNPITKVIFFGFLTFFIGFLLMPSWVMRNAIYYNLVLIPILLQPKLWPLVFESNSIKLVAVFSGYMTATAFWPQAETYKANYKGIIYSVYLLGFFMAARIVLESGYWKQYKSWVFNTWMLCFAASTLLSLVIFFFFRADYDFPKTINEYSRLTHVITDIHPNEMGWISGFTALVMLLIMQNKFQLMDSKQRFQKLSVYVVLVLAISSLLLTYSRSALLAFFTSLALFIFIKPKRIHLWFLAICFFLFILICLKIEIPYVIDLVTRQDSERFVIYQKLWEHLDENFLFGNGLLADTQVILGSRHGHPHSFFFSTLFLGGIVGLIIFCLIVGTALYQGLWLALNRDWYWGLILTLFGITCLIFDGERVINQPQIDWLIFWGPVTLTFIYYHKIRHHKTHQL